MMLGLSLGLTRRPPVQSVTGWLNWTGENDGTPNYFYTDEGVAGPTAVVGVSATELIGVTRIRSGTYTGRYASVYTVDGDTVTQETPLTLSNSNGIFSSIEKMTDSRYLITFTDTGTGNHNVFLIGKSGATLTELDADTTTLNGSGSNVSKVLRLTDTKALIAYYDGTVARKHFVIADITGDTISLGTPLNSNGGNNFYFGVSVLSDSVFIAVRFSTNGGLVEKYTVSGTTVTKSSDSIKIEDTGNFDDTTMVKVDSETVLLIYESTDLIQANTFTFPSAGGASRGTKKTVYASNIFTGPNNHNFIDVGGGDYLFSAVFQDLDGSAASSIVLSVDASKNITVGSVVASNQNGDHPTLTVLPGTNNTRVIQATQDSSTTPADQINIRVLHRE